jgi:hypothetical protein
MKNLLLAVFVLFICGHIYSQTWQLFGVPEGSGVTDLVYWSGGGAVFGDKLWATTGSVDWPTGQKGGVFYSAVSGQYQGIWYRSGGSWYVGRTLAVGQDGKLYASLWRDPVQFPADMLVRFEPSVGIFGFLYQAQAGDNIFSIAVKNNPHTIFAGTRNGVIRSTDDGVSFGYANTGIPDSSWVYDIAIDSSGILAIASSKGVFISEDNGDTWLTTTGIPPEDTATVLLFIEDTTSFSKFEYSSGDNNRLEIGAEHKIYKSFESSRYLLALIAILFSEEEEVGDHVRILKSINRAYIASRPGYIINSNTRKYGDIGGVYESLDDGTTWNKINSGLPQNPPVTSLAVKEINETSAELYAGLFNDTTGGAGVYKLAVTVGVEKEDDQIPSEYKLEQNYPNPFNPNTTIQFSIPEQSFVKLEVFNSLGEKLSTLVSEELNAGNYKYEWDAEGLPSGIFFYKLVANTFENTKKLVLLR